MEVNGFEKSQIQTQQPKSIAPEASLKLHNINHNAVLTNSEV